MKKIILINSSGLLPTQIDIYSGEETLRFNNRHPIFRTLMKLEFEEVLRSFSKKESQ
jgi:hypothetical protein